MKLRSLALTVAVLAALAAVAYYLQRPAPPPSKDPRVGQPLVATAIVEKAQHLRISDNGKTVTLARQADGSWQVTSYYDLPADFEKLSRFIGDLTDAKIQRWVTANPERLAHLEFKNTKIELLDAADKPLWSLTLGKNAQVGSGRFVRFDGEKQAYLCTISAWLDTEGRNWAQPQLTDFKPEDVASVEVPSPTGPVIVSRAKKEDPWKADHTPAGEQVNVSRVTSVLNSLGRIRFTDTTAANDPKIAAAKPHTRVFKVTTFDQKTYTIALARQPEQKKLKPPAPASLPKPGTKPEEKKPAAPEYETIPAGPVFVTIECSDASAPVNATMKKRAFEISDYVFTGLPQKSSDLFETAPKPPPPAPTPKEAGKKPEEKK